MTWTVEFFDASVRQDLESMPAEIRARFLRVSQLLTAFGPHNVREPYVKHLQGPVWEMRMRGRDQIARAAYVTVEKERIVVVHVFSKKTQKTSRRDLALALKRAKELR
jgi:phage-related protein